jgi:hypothetical protein
MLIDITKKTVLLKKFIPEVETVLEECLHEIVRQHK